jgi:hypothetical protein
LRRDGRFVHESVVVTHPRLHRALLRGVRFADQERVFVVQLGRFRGQIEVEDTPFWVVAYDPGLGAIDLTDGSSERIQPETLRRDPDEVFRLQVKGGRFPARFTRAGQAHLLDNLEQRGGAWLLRVGGRWLPVPGVPGMPLPA